MAEPLHIAVQRGWALPYFAAAAMVLLFVALVQSRGRGPVRRSFLGVLSAIAAAVASWGVVRVTQQPTVALWAGRSTLAIAAWLAPGSIAFATTLLDQPRPRLLRFGWALAALASLAALCTPWVVVSVRASRFGLMVQAGPLYQALLLELGVSLAAPILIAARLGRERRPIARRRLQLVMSSTMISSLALLDISAPLGLELPPLGWLPLLVSSTLLFLGVVRYRLLDVRLAAWRFLLWLLLTASGALPFTALAILLVRGATPGRPLTALFLGGALLLGMRLWIALVQPRVDRLVGQRRRNLALEMAALEGQLGTLKSVTEVGRAVDRFLAALGRRLAALVVIDGRGRPQLALSAWGAVPVPTRDSPLLHELQRARAPISVDEVRGPARLEIERACVRWGAEYLAPLVDGESLLGLLAVSPQQHGGTARIDEVEALDRVCVVATGALASARLYEQLQALSQELEHKAAARAKSLEKALDDLRGAEARLVANEKLATLGQIVAGVAADLREQVSAVFEHASRLRAHAEVLRRAGEEAKLAADPAFDEIVRDLPSLLDAVGEGARRASAIAQDLYGFAPAAERAAERRSLPLHAVVDSTLTLLGAQLRGITLLRSYDDSLPDVPVEPGPIGQVILNLVLNAAEAMRGKGKLALGTRRVDAATCELWVEDDGPGIPLELQSRIFEPFFTTKGHAAGTGLGLSVSFGIVERHRGRILVESAPGRGSTFRVQLPMT
jgi:signal transduction histidine kinase